MQLLYLRLEIEFELLLLCLVRRSLHFVIDRIEKLDALRDLLEGPVNLGCAPQKSQVTVYRAGVAPGDRLCSLRAAIVVGHADKGL